MAHKKANVSTNYKVSCYTARHRGACRDTLWPLGHQKERKHSFSQWGIGEGKEETSLLYLQSTLSKDTAISAVLLHQAEIYLEYNKATTLQL